MPFHLAAFGLAQIATGAVLLLAGAAAPWGDFLLVAGVLTLVTSAFTPRVEARPTLAPPATPTVAVRPDDARKAAP